MGLPDDGQDNTTVINLLTGSPSRSDPHYGLLLNKNGPSADCSAAGARIRGVEGMPVEAVFPLGFDIRNGTHCGAGAPRFNLSFRTGSTPRFRFGGGFFTRPRPTPGLPLRRGVPNGPPHPPAAGPARRVAGAPRGGGRPADTAREQ